MTQFNNIKRPEPIITTSISKSSLTSCSTSSISPSTSVLFSCRPSRSSYRGMPQPSSTKGSKLEQIIQNFYTKTVQIIIQCRITNEIINQPTRRKTNKWFNIATNDYDNLKDELKFWKSFIKSHQDEEPPPLIIDIFLETTEPDLLQEGDNTRGWRKLDLGGRRILIESWTLTLTHPLPDVAVDLPNLYKKSIVFFRSLHSLVRLLPGHKLYRRLKAQNGEIALRYRLSTHPQNLSDEVSLDKQLTSIDTTQLYKFKQVVTPLGTLNLKLLYREHCQFDTRESGAPLKGIDVEENFFTPTMTKYRQEKESVKPPTTIFPSSSMSRSRVQPFRSSRSHYPTTSTSTTVTSLERRISAPLVQPFKSPSLSSSPQKELMFPSRSQTTERRPESGSFGRKIEFSSSFEKFKSVSSSSSSHNVNRASFLAADMVRRGSRTSDQSSINLESEEDEEDLEDFMKFIGSRQELKLFRSTEVPPPQQQEDSKTSLSHFRNIQESHAILSESIHLKDTTSMESSLTRKLNLPSRPSPLHNTESLMQQENLQDGYFRGFQMSAHEIVTRSPLKNRQAPPLPPPPISPIRRISTSQEDDDSLVFKMSELSGGLYEQNEEEDYLKRLKKIDATAMRRINSSGNIPSDTKMMEVQTGHYSDDGAARHKLTNRLFYNALE